MILLILVCAAVFFAAGIYSENNTNFKRIPIVLGVLLLCYFMLCTLVFNAPLISGNLGTWAFLGAFAGYFTGVTIAQLEHNEADPVTEIPTKAKATKNTARRSTLVHLGGWGLLIIGMLFQWKPAMMLLVFAIISGISTLFIMPIILLIVAVGLWVGFRKVRSHFFLNAAIFSTGVFLFQSSGLALFMLQQ